MKMDGIRMVSILAVLLLLSTGMASILMNDDSSAATYNYNGSKTVKVNESFSATVTGQQNLTNYIADASNFSMTGAPNGVDYKYQKTWNGQKYDDDILFSGKVSTAGTYAIKVTFKHGSGITCVHTLNLTVTSPSYTHTINYNSNGGSGSMSSSTVTDNESGYTSVQLKSNGFTRSGYHFTGWYVDGSYKSPGDYVSVRGNSSVTATAQWEQDVVYYTVSFNSSGGSSCSSQTVESGKSITLPSTSKSGYSFDGWYTSSSGGSYVGMNGSSYTVTSNVTLYAHWNAITYYTQTLKFNANGGSGAPSSLTNTGTSTSHTFTIPYTTPTRSGYEFKGWSESSSATAASYQPGSSISISYNNTKTLYAVWKQNTYTATLNFNANGGSGAPSSQTYTSTSTSSHTFTIPSTTPTRSGYEFKGWSESSSATTASYQPGSTISISYNGTKTLYAVWAQTYTHTINYNSNGGSGSMSSSTVTDTSSSSSVPLANNGFSRTGYHFVGWKINNTGTTYQPGQTVSVGTSVTAYAQWEQNTISLNAIDTQYAVVGKSVSFNAFASSDPSGASITFSKSNVPSGLSVSISGSTITCSSSTTGTFTFTLTASATNYQSDSKTVTVEFVPALAFTNSPLIGVIGS